MRFVLATLVFGLTASLSCWLVLQAVAGVAGGDPQVGLDAWAEIAPRIEKLAAEAPDPAEARVVFLGDSTTFIPVGSAIPRRLEEALQGRAPHSRSVRVESLAFSGMSPFDYYYLAGPIRRTLPGRLVMNLNLAAFSEPHRAYYSRPELAAWIPPSRWLQAALLPLHYQGVTFDALLLRSLVVALGADGLWTSLVRQSVRLERAYEKASLAAQGRRHSFRGPFTRRMLWILGENGKLAKKQGPAELRERYGVSLDGVASDHPVLRVLGAAVAEYVDSGVPVTVYVNPVDVRALARAGIDGAGLEASVERARQVVEAAGGQLVDLHDLLPSRSFRDPAGHLVVGAPRTVARSLARAIAEQPDWPPPAAGG